MPPEFWNERHVCQSGAVGASCRVDAECAAGLGCSSKTERCIAITWVGPGATCDDGARCLVGQCGGPLAPIVSSNPGECPVVVPDGQPCTQTSTCDTFSQRFGGTCAPIDAQGCG